jgi:hypothetical protein
VTAAHVALYVPCEVPHRASVLFSRLWLMAWRTVGSQRMVATQSGTLRLGLGNPCGFFSEILGACRLAESFADSRKLSE